MKTALPHRTCDQFPYQESIARAMRERLDVYLNTERDPAPALAATFGADPDAHAPSRDEWDRA